MKGKTEEACVHSKKSFLLLLLFGLFHAIFVKSSA